MGVSRSESRGKSLILTAFVAVALIGCNSASAPSAQISNEGSEVRSPESERRRQKAHAVLKTDASPLISTTVTGVPNNLPDGSSQQKPASSKLKAPLRVPRRVCVSKRDLTGPSWETSSDLGPPLNTAELLKRQLEKLEEFRAATVRSNWDQIHGSHFDWWQFPCDFGSQREFNLKSEADISTLRSNSVWLSNYRESIRLVSRAFGWDIDRTTIIADGTGGSWQPNKDIRLAKMLRSLWLFGEEDYFHSLQKFANWIHSEIYSGGSFFYGTDCLDDILLLRLPRPIPFSS